MVRVYLNKGEFSRLGKDWDSGKNDVMIPLGPGRRKQRHRLVSITPRQLDEIKRASGRRKGLKQKDGYYAFPDVYDKEQLEFEDLDNFVFTPNKTATSARKYLGWYSIISKKESFNKKYVGKDTIRRIKQNVDNASEILAGHIMNDYKGKLLAEVRNAKTLTDVQKLRDIIDIETVDKGEDYVGEVEIALNGVESKIRTERKRQDSLRRRDQKADKEEVERLARFQNIDHKKVEAYQNVMNRLSKVRADAEAGNKANEVWKVLKHLNLI